MAENVQEQQVVEDVQTVQEVTLKSTDELKKEAIKITQRRTLYAAGAGLVPFPIVDAALVIGIQIAMIRSISNLYKVEFRENLVKSIIGSLVGTAGTLGVVKAIPGLGTVVGILTGSVTGAAATYALGRVFTQHFDQGGTLLDFDPVKSREFFEKEFQEGRMFVSDVTEVQKDVEKEVEMEVEKEDEKEAKKGRWSNIFKSKKKEKEAKDAAEREELVKTNQDLAQAVADLKAEVAAMKGEAAVTEA